MRQKGFVRYLLILILLAGIGVSVYLTQFTQIFKPKAYYPQVNQYPVTVGMIYSAFSLTNCNLNRPLASGEQALSGYEDKTIVTNYHKPGVRDKVKQQLAQMRSSGIQSIGLMVWFMREGVGRVDGTVSSEDGRLKDYPEEPQRTNFINFIHDVKEANFEKMLISMAPNGPSSPAAVKVLNPVTGVMEGFDWNPSRFEENWHFLQDIRSIVKEHGVADSYFDLFNEGAPIPDDSNETRKFNMTDYDRRIWASYVANYGNSDATISFTYNLGYTPPGSAQVESAKSRIAYLHKEIFQPSNVQPVFYMFSFYPEPETYDKSLLLLNAINDQMTTLGLPDTTTMRIREGWYNSEPAAQAIRDYNNTHSRKLTDVLSWPLLHFPLSDPGFCLVEPPYTQDKFIAHLPQTNGQISASPATCTIPPGEDLCSATISWSTANAVGTVKIFVRETGVLFAQTPSGSGTVDWVRETPVHLDLYDGDHLLNSITLQGKKGKIEPEAKISASPNPCILEANGLCSAKIKVDNPKGLQSLQIKVREGNNVPFTGVLPNPEGEATWITKEGYHFDLYSNDILTDSVYVNGIKPKPFPPSASPSPALKPGDLDNDGDVDIFDFNIFVGDYKTGNLRSDFNKNNKLDIFDFNLLVQNFGK